MIVVIVLTINNLGQTCQDKFIHPAAIVIFLIICSVLIVTACLLLVLSCIFWKNKLVN